MLTAERCICGALAGHPTAQATNVDHNTEREEPGGEPAVRRLRCLEAWLDYAVELGSSWLAQGPVFASHTRGYDTVDHFRIDPRLGHEDDFAGLAGAAHQRGLRIREQISQVAILQDGPAGIAPLRITISVGVAVPNQERCSRK